MFKNMLMAAAGGEGIVEVKTPWDISTMTFVESVSTGETATRGVFFKPDASVMYTVHNSDPDKVRQYSMNTSFPYRLSDRTFTNEYLLPTSNQPTGIFFKSDGLTLYVNDVSIIRTFTLSTAWNISTAGSPNNTSLTGPYLYFRSDGLKLYTLSSGGTVNEYNLSPAWSVVSASLVNTFNTGVNNTYGLFFKPDGLSYYITYSSGSLDQGIRRYNMSSSWNISTSVFEVAKATNVSLGGIFFSPSGDDLIAADDGDFNVLRYDL